MAKDDKITISAEDLEKLIDAKIKASKQAEAPPEEESFEDQLKRARGQNKPGAPVTYEECESPLTGSTFRAKIMASRSSPLGRVIDLEDYVCPPNAYIPVSQGGLCPDETIKDENRHSFWLYWEYRRRDVSEFASGKLFSTYLRKSEADARRAATVSASDKAAE